MTDPLVPSSAWLWQELRRRFGDAATDDLYAAYRAYDTAYQRQQRHAQYRAEIPQLERRLRLAQQRGEPESTQAAIEAKIAYRKEEEEPHRPSEVISEGRCSDGAPRQAQKPPAQS